MSPSLLRGLGLGGAAATLILMGADIARHAHAVAAAEAEPVDFGPDGFSQKLGGIGMIETAVRGRVRMVAEQAVAQRDGSTRFEGRFQVEGDNPRPVGKGMELTQAEIQSLNGQGFTVTAPSAWLPMSEQRSRLHFDMDQLWQLREPVLLMEDFHAGQALKILTEAADLDPATNQVYGRGPFVLDTGSLHLEGKDLYFDPARSRVEFQPLNGLISWSIVDSQGEAYEGISDGPGAFSPVSPKGDGFLLELHADHEVRSTFPATSLIPGSLTTRDFYLYLGSVEGEEQAWRLDHAVADGPTLWEGERMTMTGGETHVTWMPTGEGLQSLAVDGKVHVVPQDASFAWADAEDQAILDAESKTLRLEGEVAALHSRGILLGDWAEFAEDHWALGDRVFALGQDGMASADHLRTDRQGNWWLDGDAELRPSGQQVEWIQSPAIHFHEDGLVETDQGFQLAATVDGIPLHGSGRHLRSEPEPAWGDERTPERRTEADGSLVVVHGLRTLRGEHLRQTGVDAFRLSGEPGRPVVGTQLEQGQEIELEAGSVDWNGQGATLEEDPVLRVPASLLELQGEMAELRADRFQQDAATGGWDLFGQVRFSGALVGGADEAHWIPDQEVRLSRTGRLVEGRRERASLAGTRLDGTAWSTAARQLQLRADGSLHLQEDAEAAVQLPQDPGPTEIHADLIEWSEQAGHAEGGVRFDGPQGSGQGRELQWTRHEDGLHHRFELHGEASMARGPVQASGESLSLDTGTATMTAIGTAQAPARLHAADGRTGIGRWLRYNLDTGSFDARDARFESP